jgi:hypothetical protein
MLFVSIRMKGKEDRIEGGGWVSTLRLSSMESEGESVCTIVFNLMQGIEKEKRKKIAKGREEEDPIKN